MNLYRINSGNWTNLQGGTSGNVGGLKHNDTLYARLTNGAQYGDETSTKITDTTNPSVVVTVTGKDTSKLTVSVNATDGQSGMTSPVTYTYSIKKTSESSYVQKASNNSNTYTFTGLTQGTAYDIRVTANGDKAGRTGTGTITNQSTNTLPGGNTGVTSGAITFGSPSWGGGTASITIKSNTSYTIEYQKTTGSPNASNWTTISNGGTVSGIAHNETVYARLTDGTNDGQYASYTVKDTGKPTVSITQGEVTHESIVVNVTATDGQTGLATSNTYKYYLNNSLKATTANKTYTFTGLTAETSYSIKVEAYDKAGNIGSATKSISTIKKPGIDAGEIATKPLEFYGAEVTNYTTRIEGVDKWRIFYSDGTNIYLIADDYISALDTPNGQDGGTITWGNSRYRLNFGDVYNDYSGASWISSNSKGSKWLSQFLGSYGTSTNTNIRAVAYMMDTNVWSGYYAGEDAEYAMGGPTLEMYCASYKDTHPSKYLECGNLNSYGYQVRWNGGSWNTEQSGLVQDDFNSIYIKSDTSIAYGMWLASPSASSNGYLMNTYYGGNVDSSYYYNYGTLEGLRPLVCLKSSVQLEKQSDGTFKIVK